MYVPAPQEPVKRSRAARLLKITTAGRGLGGYGIAPVVVGSIASLATGGRVLGISFKTPSEKRAAKVLGGVVNSANAGNLNAVAILDSRRYIGIAKERAVWSGGFNRVSSSVRAAYDPMAAALKAGIPASAQSGPEAAAQWALSNPRMASAAPSAPAVAPAAPPPITTAPAAPSTTVITPSGPVVTPSQPASLPVASLPGGTETSYLPSVPELPGAMPSEAPVSAPPAERGGGNKTLLLLGAAAAAAFFLSKRR
jgi:hypothetical protein